MKNPLPLIASLGLTACAALPPQVVTVTESLRDYTERLEADHDRTLQYFHDRLARLNERMRTTEEARIARHEADVNLLAGRMDQITESYDAVASALETALHADPSKPRAAIFNRNESVDLAILVVRERQRANEARLEVESVLSRLRPAADGKTSFEIERRMARQMHNSIVYENERMQEGLAGRMQDDYEQLAGGFDDLLAFLRSRVRVKAESRRTLDRSAQTARSLQEQARRRESPLELFQPLDEALERGRD